MTPREPAAHGMWPVGAQRPPTCGDPAATVEPTAADVDPADVDPAGSSRADDTLAVGSGGQTESAPAGPRLGSLVVPALLIALLYGGSAWWRQAGDARAAPDIVALASPGDIVMLSSTTCAYCTQARRWLTEHRVPFDECFIERDAACAARYQAAFAPGTPTLLVRGRRQVGFSAQAVAQALADSPRR